ncbi:hypothetical protein OD91_0849 [Lutibacter sp. Hel_I_33_5]|nr:hypothetical protein [Lutibacter sp. Hel_I_33_5]TVZ55594.1 hypothetical protein OD91_0849 [Lutibacter sp. Hel_I_33_5]
MINNTVHQLTFKVKQYKIEDSIGGVNTPWSFGKSDDLFSDDDVFKIS